MKIVFLGTAATFPTRERAHTCVALALGAETLLFDCGEGCQRQISIAGLSPMKISKIFLTHWHGDHVLGLAGMLQSFCMNKRGAPLHIFGPKGTKEHLSYMLKAFEIKVGFKIIVNELDIKTSKKIDETDEYEIWAAEMQHTVPCLAYSFVQKPKIKLNIDYLEKFGLTRHPILKNLQEGKDIVWKGKKIKASDATYLKPGQKIVYAVDTLPNNDLVKLAKDATYFICEATFMAELREAAAERGHMTSKQAGRLAKKARAKQLILTHFSQRYRDVQPLLNEARSMFKNTIAARDFLEIKI